MRRVLYTLIGVAVLLTALHTASAEEARLANGVILKGDILGATEEGLEVQTLKGSKTYSWETLSPATRYRYDPVYRANFEFILGGLPPSARTIEPEEDFDDPDEIKAEGPEEEAEEEKEPEKPASLLIEDQVMYENIEPFSIDDFPGLELRTPETASFWGLQYGPTSEEIVYIGFDARSPEDVRDIMYVYAPASAEYGETKRFRGLKKRTRERYVARFKDIELTTQFGEINARYDIEFEYTSDQARDLSVTIEIELSSGDKDSDFILYGQPTDLVYNKGVINVRGIIDLPVMWIGLDPASAEAVLIGDVRMSRMKLCPKRGMEDDVEIELYDEKEEGPVEVTSVSLDESMFGREYGIRAELKDLERGQPQIVKARIDLGPFLGVMSCREEVRLPKK